MAEQIEEATDTWHVTSSTDDSLASSNTAVESLYPLSSKNSEEIRKPDRARPKSGKQHELQDFSKKKPDSLTAEHVEVVHPGSPEQPISPWRLAITVFSLGLSTCLVAVDNSIIGVAVPKISTVFGALDDIAWYGSAYLVATTAFQPILGKFYKFYSIKRTYLASIFIFEGKITHLFCALVADLSSVGSVVCGAAPSSQVFILGRAIAGAGAAGVFQGCLDVIGLTIPLKQRPMYVGLVMGVYSFSFCLGPVLGGVLTDRVNWRWCFLINVPAGVAVLFVSSIILNIRVADAEHNQSTLRGTLRHIDALGAVSFIGAMVCLLLALQWAGQTIAWSSTKIVGLFIGFGVLIVGFWVLQIRRGENATLPLRILRKRSVWTGAMFLFFLSMTSFVLSYYIPLFFQAVQSASATRSGVQYIALVIPQSVALVVIGVIAARWGYFKLYIIFGDILCIAGTALLTRIEVDTSVVAWAAYLVVIGIGVGVGMQLPYAVLQVVLSESDIAIGNAIAVFAWQLGGGLALAAAQTLFLNDLLHQVSHHNDMIAPEAVIRAGASGLRSLAPNPRALMDLQNAYSEAIHKPIILALVAAFLALPFALSMEWLNVKVVAQEKTEHAEQAQNQTENLKC